MAGCRSIGRWQLLCQNVAHVLMIIMVICILFYNRSSHLSLVAIFQVLNERSKTILEEIQKPLVSKLTSVTLYISAGGCSRKKRWGIGRLPKTYTSKNTYLRSDNPRKLPFCRASLMSLLHIMASVVRMHWLGNFSNVWSWYALYVPIETATDNKLTKHTS